MRNKSKIIDCFEPAQARKDNTTNDNKVESHSAKVKQSSSKLKGKRILKEPITIDDEPEDDDVQCDHTEKAPKLNLHRNKISKHLPMDVKSRLESLWMKTSKQ